MPEITTQKVPSYCDPAVIKPIVDSIIGNPAIAILALYLVKKGRDWIQKKVESASTSLWFSEVKDGQINDLLLLLRESVECDRVVLGLIVNGESSVDQRYHIRKVVLTHESRGAGIPSIRSLGQERFLATALDKEESLYGDGDFIAKTYSDPTIEAPCRRYLDSINAIAIFTFKLYREESGKKLTIGYLSFQWTNPNSVPIADVTDIEDALLAKGRRDFTYYRNQIYQILSGTSDRRNLIEKITEIALLKKLQKV
ncbi:MAG: hypothetical protein RLZZ69_3413 [Cyanobacteriota bacterium]